MKENTIIYERFGVKNSPTKAMKILNDLPAGSMIEFDGCWYTMIKIDDVKNIWTMMDDLEREKDEHQYNLKYGEDITLEDWHSYSLYANSKSYANLPAENIVYLGYQE